MNEGSLALNPESLKKPQKKTAGAAPQARQIRVMRLGPTQALARRPRFAFSNALSDKLSRAL
jgi:hypothetical protein